MNYLRQSTASQEIPLGPFVDNIDGDTAEPALTIANTSIKLFKHGATSLANKSSGGATHMGDGLYVATLDADDTDTPGMLVVCVRVSGALYVRHPFQVLTPAAYDFLFGASANPAVSPWDALTSNHTATGSFGLAWQPSNATVSSATSTTVTLATPWDTGNAVRRQIVAGGQIRVLASFDAGVYTLNAAWSAPANGTPATLGGLAPPTVAEIWSHNVRSLTDKIGFALSATGLDAISVADFAGAANTIPKMVVRTWRRFYAKADKTANAIRTFADDGTTIRTTQAISVSGDDETQGAAS